VYLPRSVRSVVPQMTVLLFPIPCQTCGKPVEHGRRCYAIPTCYGCLPPPPPLPIAYPRSMKGQEQRTRENPFDLVHRDGEVPFPTVWTVRIWPRKEWNDFAVQASEKHTGAVVPADGPRGHKTLGQARKDARALFAVVTSSKTEEPWVPE